MEKIKIILDCDLTMGLEGREIDDGLCLLYLLGREDVELLGVTLTEGNGKISAVEEAARIFWKAFHLEKLPKYSGYEACTFLADQARRYPRAVRLLALGAMANPAQTALYHPNFYQNLHSITLMGGVCEPLEVFGTPVKELNLSYDAESAHSVLHAPAELAILNGHAGLGAYFGREDLGQLAAQKGPLFTRLGEMAEGWLEWNRRTWAIEGFINWDTAAAALLLSPEYFSGEEEWIAPSPVSLRRGMLNPSAPGTEGARRVKMPRRILDSGAFNRHFLAVLEKAEKNIFNREIL